jgi:preprotein translocase subunit SecG
METIVIVVHVVAALAIIGLILLQQGKGADAGASFGAGASQTVFGASGSGNALTRGTAIFATIFFATSFGLAIFAKGKATEIADVGMPSIEVQQVAPVINDEIPVVPTGETPAFEEIPTNAAQSVPNEAQQQ